MKGLKLPKLREGLEIEVPPPGADRPRFKRAGIIAGVGFFVGVAWPRLAGIQLVPPAPVETGDTSSVAAPGASSVSAQAALAKLPLAKGAPLGGDSKPRAESERIRVQGVEVTSCRDKAGSTLQACGELDFDSVALHRIKALRACDGTDEARGTLSLGLEVDFDVGKVVRVIRGKSTTVPSALAGRLATCVEKEFESASLERIKHTFSSYTVFYKVEFRAPGESPVRSDDDEDSGGSEPVAASGRVTVGWQVALIRAEPEDGEIVARLLSGTTVFVTSRQGDWYKVKYDAKGEEGWVFKSAIGL